MDYSNPMECKQLSEADMALVIKGIKAFLEPMNPEVNFSEPPYTTIHSSVNSRNWDEYWYQINISVNGQKITISEPVRADESVLEYAWMAAYKVFKKLDDDIKSPTANNLWPKKQAILKNLGERAYGN